MAARRLFITVLIVVCILQVAAVAQDEKNEISAIVGRITIRDQNIIGPTAPPIEAVIYSGKGLTFEGNYARRFWGNEVVSLAGEVPAVFNLDEDLNSGGPIVPIDYKQIFVTPALRANLFPQTALSPWGSIGGGFGFFSENKNLIYDGGPNPGKSRTSGVLQAGVGVDVNVWRRISVRGEFRDFWSGTPDFPLAPTGKTRQQNYFLGAGVMWRF